MAKKNDLNLRTARPSDDVCDPEELPTNPAGRNRAPWATMTTRVNKSPTFTEETVLAGGSGVDLSDTPDTPGTLDSEVAHSQVPLTPQAKRGSREQFGGGKGGPRKDGKR